MIPIITYHAFGEGKSPVFATQEKFEKHLATFAEMGYESISLSDLIRWIDGVGEVPEKGVVFTFDDGYESVFSQAWPLMESYGYRGTIFVVTDYCGGMNQWPGQMKGIGKRPLMNWEQIGEMTAAGWELGAHSRKHPMMPKLTQAQTEDEIIGSQETIKHQTGIEAKIFAQPYGVTSKAVDDVVKRYFDGAVQTKLGIVRKNSNPYHLARIDAFYLQVGLIEGLSGPWVPFYLGLRQAMRRIRRFIQAGY